MIGEIIKSERLVNNMTIKQLSKASGVSLGKLYAQERGEKDLSIEDLFKVDHVLDNDIVWELVNYYNAQ